MIDPVTLGILKRVGPYIIAALVAFGAGWSGAWYVQGVRLASLKNEFAEYKNDQTQKALDAQAGAQKLFDDTTKAWAAAVDKVRNDKDAYARCVAAGRCLPNVPACPGGGGLQAPGGNNVQPGRSAVPAPAGTAIEGLIADCKNTQLKLNQARNAVRAQKGY